MRAAGWICLCLAALLACAEMGPPPGGPVDKTPADLVGAEPGSLATEVAARTPLIFEFSEKIDRATFSRAIRIVPPVDLEKAKFDGLRVRVQPRDDWPDSVAIVWSLETTLKDKHGVKLPRALSGAFTRAGEFPPGALAGSATWDEDPNSKEAVAVAELFRMPREGERRRMLWRRDYLGPDRSFRLRWLVGSDGPYELEVYLDRNGSGSRDEHEFTARLDSLFLPDSLRTLDVGLLRLVDLEAPVGIWLCSAPPQDSVRSILYGISIPEGSLRSASLDSTGCGGPLLLEPGPNRAGLFRDLDADGRFGPDSLGICEPFLRSIEFEVIPAQPETLALDGRWEQLPWATLDSLTGLPPRDLWWQERQEAPQ